MQSFKAVRTYTHYALLILLLTVAVSALVVLATIHREALDQAKTALSQRMQVFQDTLAAQGQGYVIQNGQLYAGRYLLNGSNQIPDRLAGIFGGTYTIFMGDQRVATNVRGADGNRITGTRLIGPAYDAVFGRGESFYDEADILGERYFTRYEPLRDATGAVIGALYSGVRRDVYLAHFNRLSLGAVGLLLCVGGVCAALYLALYRQGRQAALQAKRELMFLQTLMDTMPVPVFYKDNQGGFLGCNSAFEKLVGAAKAEIIGRKVHNVLHDSDFSREQARVDRELAGSPLGTRYSVETRMTTADGAVRDVQIIKSCFQDGSGSNAGIIGSVLDITERRQLEQVRLESEKMLTVGRLAEGMAHELNNPIGSILQNTQNIQRRFSPELGANRKAAAEVGLELERLQAYMDQRGINEMLDYIARSGAQASGIVGNLLAFCSSGAQRSPAAVDELIDSAIEQVRRDGLIDHGEAISMIREYEQDLPLLSVNSAEIVRALANLIKNGVQAAREGKRAKHARVSCRARQIERNILIEIEDNGDGIRPGIGDHIFDPFFTTREVGSGSGMGLSVAYALVVNNHGGSIRFETPASGGTCVCVTLPLAVARLNA